MMTEKEPLVNSNGDLLIPKEYAKGDQQVLTKNIVIASWKVPLIKPKVEKPK